MSDGVKFVLLDLERAPNEVITKLAAKLHEMRPELGGFMMSADPIALYVEPGLSELIEQAATELGIPLERVEYSE